MPSIFAFSQYGKLKKTTIFWLEYFTFVVKSFGSDQKDPTELGSQKLKGGDVGPT